MNAAIQHVIEEFGDVAAHGCRAAAQSDVAEERGVDHLDTVRDADKPTVEPGRATANAVAMGLGRTDAL